MISGYTDGLIAQPQSTGRNAPGYDFENFDFTVANYVKRERFVPGNGFLFHWIFQIPGEFSKRDSQPPLRSRNAEFVKRTFLFSDFGGFLPIILTELNSGGSVKPEIHWEAKLNL